MNVSVLAARLDAKTDKTGACWVVPGKQGTYPKLFLGTSPGACIMGHRLAWIAANGPIPDGMNVCHQCDNTRCVRPDHLFIGTQRDNVRDMAAKGRHWVQRNPGVLTHVGEDHPNAKLTVASVREIRAMSSAGKSQQFIARHFGVSRATVVRIIRRQAWRTAA